MKNKLLFISLITLLSLNLFAQQNTQDKKMAWWREARFGMFIHCDPMQYGVVTIMVIYLEWAVRHG